MTLALLLTAVTGAWAQGPWTSGDCTVTLNNGTLTVSGNGAMEDYPNLDQPWENNKGDITSVVVESGVTTVGALSFCNFGKITSVTLPEGLTSIGTRSFLSCSKLTSITIPSTVTSIDAEAFYSCTSVTDVNLYADPANLTWNEDGCDDFNRNPKGSTKCHVLAEHLSAYQTKFNGQVNVTFVGDLKPQADGPEVTTNAASEQDLFTEAKFNMPPFDATVNYMLVRDMQDETNPVIFSGLPTNDEPIIVKKGSDGKYQPAEALTIQLIDPLAAAEAQNIIAADGITIKVLVGAENELGAIDYDQDNPITLDAFLADMKPGYYWIKAEPTDENSPYDGTVYSSEFTAVEKYDLTVKPANDFSKGKVESVTVGTGSVTIDANTGEATKTGIDPDTEVKIKAKRGYVIEKVEAKKTGPAEGHALTSAKFGEIVGSDGKAYAADDKDNLPSGVTAVAMICYVSGSHGLALALADEAGEMNWSTAQTTCAAHTPAITGGTWKLATKDEWDNMITAAGSHTALRDGFSSVGGTNMQSDFYWSSTPISYGAWYYTFDGGKWTNGGKGATQYVRACLAF